MLRLMSSCCCRCSRTEETASRESQNSSIDNTNGYPVHEEQTNNPATPNTDTFASPSDHKPDYEFQTSAVGLRKLQHTDCPQTTASDKELVFPHDPNDENYAIKGPEITNATELDLMQTNPHITESDIELRSSKDHEEDIHAIRSAKIRTRQLLDIPEGQHSIASSTSGPVSRRADKNGKFMNYAVFSVHFVANVSCTPRCRIIFSV